MRCSNRIAWTFFLVAACSLPGASAGLSQADMAGIDDLVVAAYEAASAGLPCKIGTTGKAHMMRWQDVDKCMSRALGRIDWEELSRRLISLRPATVPPAEFASVVAGFLAKHALAYERLFTVKDKNALLPLTNSILKYMPRDSLKELPISDRAGQRIGTFAGTFAHEHAGDTVSGNPYTITLFQYLDPSGQMQMPSMQLLLDSFGIPWSMVVSKPGFQIPVDNIPGLSSR